MRNTTKIITGAAITLVAAIATANKIPDHTQAEDLRNPLYAYPQTQSATTDVIVNGQVWHLYTNTKPRN